MSSTSSQLKHKIIRASAGSGKTSSLIDTFVKTAFSYYDQKKVFPKVTISTFTRKATREIKERLLLKAIEKNNEQFIDYISYSSHLQISTIHGLLNHFLQIHGHYIGLSPGFIIMNEDSSHELFVSTLKEQLFSNPGNNLILLEHYSFDELTDIMKKYILHIREYPNSSPIDVESIKQDFERKILDTDSSKTKKLSKQLDDFEDNKNTFLQSFNELSRTLNEYGVRVLESWTQKKLELSCIDYNDLEFMSLVILKKQSFIEKQWDFFFLDEYQDTSPVQQKVLNYLTKNSSVFIVGDPQQSIYRFRGADESVFKNKEEEIQKVETNQVIKKRKNFRSSPELIAFFNDVFCNHRKEDKSYNSFEAMEPYSSQYDNKTEVAKIILTQKSPDAPKEAEYEVIFKRITELLSKKVKPGEIAILSHKNKSLHQLSRYLKNKNVPVYIHSTGQFHKNREIQDAVFLLRFLINPHHNENLIRLLRTVYLRIPDQILANWTNQTNHKSLWSIGLKEKQDYPVIQFLNHYLEETTTKGIVQAFQNSLEDAGFFDLSYYQDPTGLSEANLWKLIYQLKNHTLSNSLLSFTDRLLQDRQLSEQDIESNNAVSAATDLSSVQLMTIHAAKGLEFENVILIDINSNLNQSNTNEYFSQNKTIGQWVLKVRSDKLDKRISSPFQEQITENEKKDRIKEMDRLFYVALTRAKKTITLTGSTKSLKKPITKNSWMERFSFLSKLQDGTHLTKYYTYSKNTPLLTSKPLSIQSNVCIKSSPFLSKSINQETVKTFSVHDLLLPDKATSDSPVSYLSDTISSGLKGQRVHQMMESFRYDHHIQELSSHSELKKETQETLKYTTALKEIPLKELLHTGFTEWPFRWKIKENCFFTGRIDLWGKTKESLWIIDYKTSSQELQKEMDFQQLSFYALVLNQMNFHLPIKRCLIYISQKKYFIENTPQTVLSNCYKQITQFLSNKK